MRDILLRVVVLVSVTVLAVATTNAVIIPDDLRITWQGNVGVPGGIPNRTTIFTTLNPGVTASDINAALAACPSNQVVFLSAGVYNINELIYFDKHAGVTLRGAGPGLTIISNTVTGVGASVMSNGSGKSGATPITGGYTKGSTSVTLSDASGLNVNDIVILSQDDKAGLVFAKTTGQHLYQRVIVTAKSGNTISFNPPLVTTFEAVLNPLCTRQNETGLRFSGIEDMTMTAPNVKNIIWFDSTYACWARNVEFVGCDEASIWITSSLRFEMRQCHGRDTRSTNQAGYGIYLYKQTSSCLVEDNIFSGLFAGVMITGGTGHAILYNYSTDSYVPSFSHQVGNMNMNHGPHGMMTLWEGNFTEQFQNDGYHGSTSHQTLFRNVAHGLHPSKNGNRKMIDLCRFSYYQNIVGNVLGNPSWSSDPECQYEMVGQPRYTAVSVIYRLGYPNMGNNSLTTSIAVPGEPASYPDVQVENTLLRHGNYDYHNEEIIWDAGISDRDIPPSLYYASKPTYFQGLPWPPVNPMAPNTTNPTNIPAGYRFFNQGGDPPGGDPRPPSPPSGVKVIVE